MAKTERRRSFTCSDCRITIERQSQFEAWETMRLHTLEMHGREPYCNPAGQYPSDEVQLHAEFGAFPERFLILAA